MDPLDAIERLAEPARKEAAPETDVADEVLARIRARGTTVRVLPLSLLAVASAAVPSR